MKIIDVLSAPWAIQPEMFQTILGVYDRWARGETAVIAEIEAKLGKPLNNKQVRYTVTPEGVAVIPIHGVLGKRMNMMSDISGGASTQLIAEDLAAALTRDDVKAILFDVDSPGGAVNGTLELAREIFQARGRKPMATVGDGLMASAAMWIGAAADEVYLASEISRAGSIGVVTRHTDMSGWEEKVGVKTTVLTAGKYKALGNEHEPLSEEARSLIQEELDYVYSLFVNDIAKFRGSDVETVLDKMADGRMFAAPKAVKVGLVDGIMSREQVIKRLTGKAGKASITTGGNARNTGGGRMEGLNMAVLRAEHQDLVQAFIEEGRLAGIIQGAAAELARIQAVEAQSMPGHEALIAALKFDGKTTGPEAAVQVLAAEKANNAKLLGKLETEAPDPAKRSVPETQTEKPLTEAQAKIAKQLGISAEQYKK